MTATTLLSEHPVASREHHCVTCGGTIPRGERYVCDRVRVGQVFRTVRTHFLCPIPKPAPVRPPALGRHAHALLAALCVLVFLALLVAAVAFSGPGGPQFEAPGQVR